MKLINIKTILFILSNYIFLSSLTLGAELYHSPNLSPQELLVYIQQKDIVDNNYYLEDVSYNYIKKEWSFFYIKKESALGGHFFIKINDENINDIEIIGGL